MCHTIERFSTRTINANAVPQRPSSLKAFMILTETSSGMEEKLKEAEYYPEEFEMFGVVRASRGIAAA